MESNPFGKQSQRHTIIKVFLCILSRDYWADNVIYLDIEFADLLVQLPVFLFIHSHSIDNVIDLLFHFQIFIVIDRGLKVLQKGSIALKSYVLI